MALKHRPYQFIYINHDSSNRKSGAIPQRLGYKLADTFDSPIHAKMESGFWYSWVKESDRYSDCVNERLMDLRFANLWCDMIKEMHIDIYEEIYSSMHTEGLRLYREELESVLTKDQGDVA
jgi:hypothetical protein